MALVTLGVKLDEGVRERLKEAAGKLNRTPHWLIKQAIHTQLEALEDNAQPKVQPEINEVAPLAITQQDGLSMPFVDFAANVQAQSVLRAAITAAWRRPEAQQVAMLLPQAALPAPLQQATEAFATQLAEGLRQHQSGKKLGGKAGLVQELLQEFSLSSQEGVALMCLAEALLRIPDRATRDALIRDKIGSGNWQAHLGKGASLFVNAATWGLMLTGKLTSTHTEEGLSSSLTKMLARGGEPVVRKGVDMAMHLMGEQFVMGQTIGRALAQASRQEARGWRYSYDMLGEAALTEADARRYMAAYEQAIHAIGRAAAGAGIYRGPGISIKLSALHPRYSRAQYERVMDELYPRLLQLAELARSYDIGINIDAEEADRLEISLDVLEKLCYEPALVGWNGIGFVVQAYQKRCPHVLDFLIALARKSGHRLMIRLVKGAYWDSEIKRAQLEGLEDYPVYTRKAHTDLAYIACARQLLAAPEAIFPQFATHNAHTVAAIYHLAGHNFYEGQYEFQCLHGMGEPLYQQIVTPEGSDKAKARPCRIYAPVGSHETLLAYLVRRLLENGANTSFVNRVADPNQSIAALVADPVAEVQHTAQTEGQVGLPHPRIPLPRALYGERPNSQGLDLANEQRLAGLSAALLHSAASAWVAKPLLAVVPEAEEAAADAEPIRNPACQSDVVGTVRNATPQEATAAVGHALAALDIWQATPPAARAQVLERAADMLETRMPQLIGLLVREAGKTYANAIAEVREAVDFLRYYAAQVRQHFDNGTHQPLGVVVCISPWNFPLAIFIGQIAAALAAGNSVLAKPAEQTPLIAFQATQLLHQAGVPRSALQWLPGAGETVGAALVADARIRGVLFTGSTQVARLLQRTLAGRVDEAGQPITLIAETGGQNAMMVDSSALLEQVVADIMASAFDSAGQRCSAMRLVCLQEDIAPAALTMLRGAMQEWTLGKPEHLSVDIGPVIDSTAQQGLLAHIEAMRAKGRPVFQSTRVHSSGLADGIFVPPTLIEIESVAELEREVFGPVLHVLRYAREDLDSVLDAIHATGYGLTMGVHSRIDETIGHIACRAHVGNLYVNRNMVGAVVGVQPFGGEGLSGTGPKAGGPLYLRRLLAERPLAVLPTAAEYPSIQAPEWQPLQTAIASRRALLTPLADGLAAEHADIAALCQRLQEQSPAGHCLLLPGPTGERNLYLLLGRQHIACLAEHDGDRLAQLAAVLAVGAQALWPDTPETRALHARLPAAVQSAVTLLADWLHPDNALDAVLYHGDIEPMRTISRSLAERPGPIVGLHAYANGARNIQLDRLLTERSLSVNTAAAGGNASLMSIG